ncbi:MAG: hypothetical protein ACLRX6_03360 [Limosilactobacillus pontis]|uniref:hypothetical protein n=1 Tax=Limosilactobacillus pontis TaxID=35787 RepID=UPI0039A08BA0
MKFYYVMSPIGFVREICVAHDEQEAIKLAKQKYDRKIGWMRKNKLDDGDDPQTHLAAREITPGSFSEPQVINLGLWG